VRQTQFPGGTNSRSLGHIRDHDADFDARKPAFTDRSRNGQEVRTAAGQKDAEPASPIIRGSFQDFPKGHMPRPLLLSWRYGPKPVPFKKVPPFRCTAPGDRL